MKKFQHSVQNSGRGSFGRLVGVRKGVATWVYQLALRLSLESVCLIIIPLLL